MTDKPTPAEPGVSPPSEADNDDDVIQRSVPAPTKTPLFQAIHAERYQRQAIIKNIQERSGHRLICYVSGSGCAIDRDDTVPFVDLLHNVPPAEDLDLLLHTGGGDIDAAEKLISMVRTKVGAAKLRVVVPDFAKSAGTLMVLGADCVVMSDTSELGPIDPQVILADGNGNRIRHSVQSYLDAVLESAPVRRTWSRAAVAVAVRERSGQQQADYQRLTAVIAVPLHSGNRAWALRELVILHELAHHLADSDEEPHGPGFAGRLISLISVVIGEEAGFLLRTTMWDNGVRIG